MARKDEFRARQLPLDFNAASFSVPEAPTKSKSSAVIYFPAFTRSEPTTPNAPDAVLERLLREAKQLNW